MKQTLLIIVALVCWLAFPAAGLTDSEAVAIGSMLDDFHEAASKADGKRYFAHFADKAIFMGTDATERWTVSEFKAYANPHFDKGEGWTYKSVSRHIQMAPDGKTAWFDELLDNAKYGTCRGSGVVSKIGKQWRISQYNLSLMIPNERAKEVVKLIGASGSK